MNHKGDEESRRCFQVLYYGLSSSFEDAKCIKSEDGGLDNSVDRCKENAKSDKLCSFLYGYLPTRLQHNLVYTFSFTGRVRLTKRYLEYDSETHEKSISVKGDK